MQLSYKLTISIKGVFPMKKKSMKVTAVILSAMLAISAGAVFAATAYAAPANTQISVSVKNTVPSLKQLSGKWVVDKITDTDNNELNPYALFGSSIKLSHEMILNQNGTFSLFLGASCGNDPSGTFTYNKASGKLALSYQDGFRAMAYVAKKSTGELVLQVPVKVHGNIIIVDFVR